jgi:hypothetical protein
MAKEQWPRVFFSYKTTFTCKKRFETGSSEDKKVIFKAIGVNSIIKDQKLDYTSRFVFLKIKEGVKKMKDKIKRLEPKNSPVDRDNLKGYLKSSLWCRGPSFAKATEG